MYMYTYVTYVLLYISNMFTVYIIDVAVYEHFWSDQYGHVYYMCF